MDSYLKVKHTVDNYYNFNSGSVQEIVLKKFSGGRYDGREDFTVVIQPYFRNAFVPFIGPDLSFFSVDCFHVSERAHAEMAIALWNNMLEPVGRKQVYNNFTYDRTKINCPFEVC
uniref:Uncharacterized protein n=1 Tax=Hucho hucho TaxID=62062 RepID=A0A4W5S0M9_9TELE